MLVKKFINWLALAMMLSILAACGGGSTGSEPSSLLSGTAGSTGSSGTGGTTTDTTEPKDIVFFVDSPQILPGASSGVVTITVFRANAAAEAVDENGNTYTDISKLVTESNVPLQATVTGDAYFLENGKNYLDVTTDQRGQISFTVAHTGNGRVLLTIQGRDNYQGGGTSYLYFGASVVAEVLNNNTEIPADGLSSAQIVVTARDASLAPISGLDVELRFSPDSQAVVTTETGFITDANGQVKANVTNIVEQAVSIIPYAGGGRGNTLKLNFTKIAQSTAIVTATLVNGEGAIIAADGQSAAKVIVVARSASGASLAGLPVTLSFPTNSFAVASPASGSTDENGQFITDITNYVTQTTSVTPIVGNVAADTITLNFGTSEQQKQDIRVTATLLTTGAIPANGTTTAKFLVLARDLDGVPVEGLPVALAFPKDSFAVATQSIGKTDANGQFLTEISDSIPESVSITAIVAGITSNTVTIQFTASGGGESPTELDIRVSDSNALANGSDRVQVIIVARDGLGNVVPNIPVKLRGGSATSVMRVEGTNSIGTLYVSGNTGTQGLSVSISNSVAESLTLDAVAVVNGAEITGESQAVIFTDSPIVEEDNIATVSLEALTTEQVADGKSTITLSGQALTRNGVAVANAQVSFETIGKARIAIDNNARTYGDGRFFATVTDENVESFSIRAVVQGISSPPVILTFTSKNTTDDGTVVTPGLPPSRVNIIATPQKQLADGKSPINFTVMVWDNSNTPMEGVQVSLSAFSGTVSNTTLFDKAKETTGASGTATFNITNTKVGQVIIRATAQGIDSEGNPSGTTQYQDATLTFINPIQATQLALDSSPTSAIADGQTPITVTVTAKDNTGATVAGVPISIILGDETARATPSNGTTDANGMFTTQVTSRKVDNLQVTAQVRDINLAANTVLQFTSTSSSRDVTKLVISQFSDNEQLANGKDEVTIQISALDDEGTPVANVPIELITSADFPVAFSQLTGVTGADGIFTTTVSSIEVGTVSITAQAPDTANNLRSQTILVKFNASNQTAVPATVTLTIENNSQPADGNTQIILVAKVLDEKGQPVVGTAVELISNNPALDPADGTTNGLGEWRTTLSSAVATSIIVTAVTTGGSSTKQSTPQTIIFIEVAQATPPASLVLNSTVSTAAVNETINLIASAKDANGTPMSDVNIAFQIVSGAGIFQSDAVGATSASGTFSSTITSTEAGIVEVRATASSVTSNTIALTFERSVDTQVPVADLVLFSSVQSLDSAGDSEGVIISARAKDAQNNILVGKKVSFKVNSGAIQPVSKITTNDGVSYGPGEFDGITDSSGLAYARLTTVGNPNNRAVTVEANSETKTAQPLVINVTGTKIIIEGQNSIVLDLNNPAQNSLELTITLQDSASKGITGKSLLVNSAQGHALSATQVVTNSTGQATVTLTLDPSKVGTDTITVEKVKEEATETTVSATHSLNVSDEQFTLTYNGTISSSGVIEIPIGSSSGSTGGSGGSGLPCVNTNDPNCNDNTGSTDNTNSSTFTVRWLQGGAAKTGEHIGISTTRGSISSIIPSDGLLDQNGELTFKISADNVGQATITAIADAGPSASIKVEFIAVTANKINLQASRPVLNPNSATSNDAERSEIVATVWDVNNNLVKNKVVDFNLNDVSGGRLTQSRAVTDSNGQASTAYVAGFNSSAANGITITATVVGDNVTPATVKLTVAQRDLFITIGSGNTLLDEDGIRYETLHTVLVTDSNGTPVNGAEVTLSIYPTRFVAYSVDADGNQQPILCKNEDINRNGILDSGEDVNNNGRLDPGSVITFNTQSENALTLTTGQAPDGATVPNGYADFRVVYAVSFASYLMAEITARAAVSGTEEAYMLVDFAATCSKEDADQETCPVLNPFRNIGSCLVDG